MVLHWKKMGTQKQHGITKMYYLKEIQLKIKMQYLKILVRYNKQMKVHLKLTKLLQNKIKMINLLQIKMMYPKLIQLLQNKITMVNPLQTKMMGTLALLILNQNVKGAGMERSVTGNTNQKNQFKLTFQTFQKKSSAQTGLHTSWRF